MKPNLIRVDRRLFADLHGHVLKYKRGQRVKHVTLGAGTVLGRGTSFGGAPTTRVRFDDLGEREICDAFCVGRIRALAPSKPTRTRAKKGKNK